MTHQAIHYDSTWLIRIHITWSNSADACTFGGYLCSPPSCSPLSYVLQCYNKSISLTTRLALRRFQASYYSHHRSQSTLGETNWLLRVSRCNLTLNPYLVIQMGHHHGHPLPGAMELRFDHWSATLKVSPRDPKELCTNTDKNTIIQSNNIHHARVHSLCQPLKPLPFTYPFQLIIIHSCT